jgi:hypothetical protein
LEQVFFTACVVMTAIVFCVAMIPFVLSILRSPVFWLLLFGGFGLLILSLYVMGGHDKAVQKEREIGYYNSDEYKQLQEEQAKRYAADMERWQKRAGKRK